MSEIGLRRKFKFHLRNLLVPETWGYWNCTDFQKLMALYQWMAETAQPYYRYGSSGAFDLLNGQPTVRGEGYISGFGRGWKEDLQRRFHYVLMSAFASDLACQWRRDFKIGLDTEVWIQQPWVESGWMFDRADRLNEVDGFLKNAEQHVGPQTLRWNLNSSHRERARTIQYVTLNLSAHAQERKYGEPRPARWYATLYYGYPKDSSRWDYVLARQRKGEPLLHMIRRAQARLDQLTGTKPAEPWEPASGYYLEAFRREEWDQGGPLQNVVTRYYSDPKEAFDYRRMEYGADVLYFEISERERGRIAEVRERSREWLAKQRFCPGCGFMLDGFSYRGDETECYRCARQGKEAAA